ncbi:MAG: hypothetical protein K6T28_02075 [Acidothermus sp.]|nr:hypothetical protein [Acidothermus sp.]
MKGPLDIRRYLLDYDVPHEIVRLRRPVAHATELPEVLDISADRVVVVHPFEANDRSRRRLVVLMAPASTRLEPLGCHTVLAQLLREMFATPVVVAPASAEMVSRWTDYAASHVAPLLLPADVPVFATPALEELGGTVVYTPTGDSGTALAIPAGDLITLAGARIAPVETRNLIVLDRNRVVDVTRGPVSARSAQHLTEGRPPLTAAI